jgi:hypothetical protein
VSDKIKISQDKVAHPNDSQGALLYDYDVNALLFIALKMAASYGKCPRQVVSDLTKAMRMRETA